MRKWLIIARYITIPRMHLFALFLWTFLLASTEFLIPCTKIEKNKICGVVQACRKLHPTADESYCFCPLDRKFIHVIEKPNCIKKIVARTWDKDNNYTIPKLPPIDRIIIRSADIPNFTTRTTDFPTTTSSFSTTTSMIFRGDDPYAKVSPTIKWETGTNVNDTTLPLLPIKSKPITDGTFTSTSSTIFTTDTPSSKTSPISTTTVNPEFLIPCTKAEQRKICGAELACKYYPPANGSYCICASDGKYIHTIDNPKCNKKIVARTWDKDYNYTIPKLPPIDRIIIKSADMPNSTTRRTYFPKRTTDFPTTTSSFSTTTSSFPTTTSSFPTTTFSFPTTTFNFTTTTSNSTSSTIAYPDLSNFTTTIDYSNSTNYTLNPVSQQIAEAPNFLPLNTSASMFLLVAALLVVISVLCSVWKCCLPGFKKKKTDENKAVIIPLQKIVMKDQRYTTNPQYSTPAGTIPMDISIGSVPLLNRNSITELKKIGEGFFGEVYRGLLHSIDNEEEHVETVAIKMLKQTANKAALEDFLREVEIISSFQHPNILTLVGVCPQENTSPPWMIFEYMTFGDLADVLRNSNPEFRDPERELLTLSPETMLSISSQIAAGMEYLAAQRFVHRDLACRNCLVGSSMTVKISDFGMSRDVYTCDYYRVGGKRMLPIRWMSPEGLSFGKFTLESDVWAYGVVLWEIYSHGKQPYYGYTNEQAMKLIIDRVLLEIPENCPNEIADIMRSCWQINPKDRLQFLDICNLLSALKERIDEISAPPLPRPPPMPVTINYPLPFDDDELDDMSDDDNYLRPISRRSSAFLEPSNSSLNHSDSSSNPYMEAIP